MLQVIVDQLVDQTANMKLNKLTIQPIFKQIRKSCPKSGLPEMNILFKCCYVLILSLREQELLFRDVEELFTDYPEFVNLPAEELQKLLKFRNAIKISLQLIEARHHKGELLEIAGRLSGKLVTTGGSQTTETKRRVLVYEREGGLEVEKATNKNTKRKCEAELKIKEEDFCGSLTKKQCTAESVACATVPLSRNASAVVTAQSLHTVKTELKSEPSLLPKPVAAFISQQLMSKFSASDAANYQAIIERTVVQTTANKELNKLTLRPILKELRKLFPRKEIWAEMNILFKCCYVLILSLRDDSLLWLDQRQFLENYRYPEFADLNAEEVQKLMVFRNAMRVSLQLIEAKHHKGELLEIAGRLSGRSVTTGGGQTADTTRCVMIYEHEGIPSSEHHQRIPQPKLNRTPRVKQEQESLDNLESLMLMEGVAGLGSIRHADVPQRKSSSERLAQLDRADTGMSLFGTFSLQSLGSLGRLGSLSEFDFVSPLPLPVSENTEVLADVSALSSPAKKVAPAVPPAPRRNKPRKSPSPQKVNGEQDTDIDTELDSVEVATEVDENEVQDSVELEQGDLEEHQPVQEQDAEFFQGLFQSQSIPLGSLAETETVHSQYGLGSGLYPTETISSVDMCYGIARLGSLPTLTPEFFVNNLYANGVVPSRSPTVRDDVFASSQE